MAPGSSCTIDLPYPPSVNHYYRRVGARTLISRDGRAYRTAVCGLLKAAGVEAMSGPLAIMVEVYPPDHRRRDLDNTLKSLLDSLQHGGLYRDDSQIARIVVARRQTVPGGRATVVVAEIDPEEHRAALRQARGAGKTRRSGSRTAQVSAQAEIAAQ
jgi:crossover junction endodeoxyribonuclease RusA